jgi:dUTP pyrophosphatase
VCGAPISLTPTRATKNATHTCSKKCAGVLASARYSDRLVFECICGTEVRLKRSQALKRVYPPTCSMECSRVVRSARSHGDSNPNSHRLFGIDKLLHERTANIRVRAAGLGVPFDIPPGHLKSVYDLQQGLCYYSQVPMSIQGTKSIFTLSVDRIDPAKGYTKGNVVLCCLGINMMKSDAGLDAFFQLIAGVANHHMKILVPATKELVKDPGNAGFDLRVSEGGTIPARGSKSFSTELKLAIPQGVYGQILSRSGLAFNHGLQAHPGVIDSSYRGEVRLLIFNHSDNDFVVNSGDRMAQIVFLRHVIDGTSPDFLSAPDTERSTKGFGSSGIQ